MMTAAWESREERKRLFFSRATICNFLPAGSETFCVLQVESLLPFSCENDKSVSTEKVKVRAFCLPAHKTVDMKQFNVISYTSVLLYSLVLILYFSITIFYRDSACQAQLYTETLESTLIKAGLRQPQLWFELSFVNIFLLKWVHFHWKCVTVAIEYL